MAKTSVIAREDKRSRMRKKFISKRQELKLKAKKARTMDERIQLLGQIEKLPLNSSPVRQQRRCRFCGRPHGVYRKFGLCRIHLRELLMVGHVTGARKASW